MARNVLSLVQRLVLVFVLLRRMQSMAIMF